jgi:NAD(P)-dependent dehydrogenase (short-subunit alcohol dehydrogenase family)
MPTLKDKVVLVTAAGQGIGPASAEAFARAGARVWATDLDDRTKSTQLSVNVVAGMMVPAGLLIAVFWPKTAARS